MLKARYKNIDFQFKFPAGTSRGILLNKHSSFIILEENELTGIGECSLIKDLSVDPLETYPDKLNEICFSLNNGIEIDKKQLACYPSITFGLETALLDLKSGGQRAIFHNSFSEGKAGIPINGLVWMGDKTFMQQQIREKINTGYRCIKLKVGALNFDTELEIIAEIRKQFSPSEMEIRLDANGGFTPENAPERLERLAKYHIHSIEQPIKQNKWNDMARICEKSPIPVVLDEELIGIYPDETMLTAIKPAYIILKPSLIGGFGISEKWIELAEKNGIGWWVTSALEANIGLNAIAQWTYSLNSSLPQGLGTGQLYHNNIPSPLEIRNARLFYNPQKKWDLSDIL